MTTGKLAAWGSAFARLRELRAGRPRQSFQRAELNILQTVVLTDSLHAAFRVH